MNAPSTDLPRRDTPWHLIGLGLFINLLWGGNLVAVKLGLTAFPPLSSAFLRFTFGAGSVLPVALLGRTPLWPKRGEWPALLILGSVFTVQIGIMNWGTHLTTAGVATTLMSTNPLFASLFAHFFVPGDRLTPRSAVGLLLAFGGVCVILLGKEGGAATWPLLGNLLVLTSGAMLGGRLIFAQRILQRIDTLRVVFWQMLISLPLFAIGALATEKIDPAAIHPIAVAAVAYQGIAIAGLGYSISASLLRRYRPSIVTSFNFTTPVFGVLLSVPLLGESPAATLWYGLAAVAVGLLIITTAKNAN